MDPEELEVEKNKLADIRAMKVETLEKIKRLEDELSEQRILHQKKLRNIRKVQSTQDARLSKLTNDIKLVSNLVASRREEYRNLLNANEDGTAELKRTQGEKGTEVAMLKKKIEELNAEVKQAYVDLHDEKELQVLMEVGLSNVKEDDNLPLNDLETILKKRQESIKQRQEEVSKEISKIEEEQANVEMEIKQKQDKLVALKDTYIELINNYKKAKAAT